MNILNSTLPKQRPKSWVELRQLQRRRNEVFSFLAAKARSDFLERKDEDYPSNLDVIEGESKGKAVLVKPTPQIDCDGGDEDKDNEGLGAGHYKSFEDFAEKESLRLLYHLIAHVKLITKTKNPLFHTRKISSHEFRLKTNPTGRFFLSSLSTAHIVQKHFLAQRLNPYFKLFWKHAAEPMQAIIEANPGLIFDSEEQAGKFSDSLNNCINELRELASSKKFIKECNDFFRSSRKNNQQLLKYVRRHSETNGRLLICRCDLGAKRDASLFYQASNLRQAQILKESYKLLFEFIKKRFGEKLLGFAWKLEFGVRRGFHYHLMLIFNGRELKSDISIVRIIGEYWKNEITKGSGTYFNCNAYKEHYKSCGIGMFSKEKTPEKWEGIKLMCAYLTKGDDLVRLHLQGMRCFGKGNMPKTEALVS